MKKYLYVIKWLEVEFVKKNTIQMHFKVHFLFTNIWFKAIPKLTPAEAAPKHAEGGSNHTDKDDKDHDEVIRPAAPLKTKLQKKAASVLRSGRSKLRLPDLLHEFLDIPGPPKGTVRRRS